MQSPHLRAGVDLAARAHATQAPFAPFDMVAPQEQYLAGFLAFPAHSAQRFAG